VCVCVVVLLTGDDDDYVLAELQDEQLVVRVQLRSGVFETRLRQSTSSIPLSASDDGHARRRFNDDRWHKLVVNREVREVTLSVRQSFSVILSLHLGSRAMCGAFGVFVR